MTNQNTSQLIIYQSEDGQTKLDVRFMDGTVWLTQAQMAQLFSVQPQNITIHIKNIYAEQELTEISTCKDILQVQTEGGYQVKRLMKNIFEKQLLTKNSVVKHSFTTARGCQRFRRSQNKLPLTMDEVNT